MCVPPKDCTEFSNMHYTQSSSISEGSSRTLCHRQHRHKWWVAKGRMVTSPGKRRCYCDGVRGSGNLCAEPWQRLTWGTRAVNEEILSVSGCPSGGTACYTHTHTRVPAGVGEGQIALPCYHQLERSWQEAQDARGLWPLQKQNL